MPTGDSGDARLRLEPAMLTRATHWAPRRVRGDTNVAESDMNTNHRLKIRAPGSQKIVDENPWYKNPRPGSNIFIKFWASTD